MAIRSRFCLVVGLAALGCAKMPEQATIRSPALDYPQAVAQTSNGEIVGADQQPPPDAIKTNAAVGTNGITPGGRPAPAELGTPRPKPPEFEKQPTPNCSDQGILQGAKDPKCWTGNYPGK